MPRTRWSRRERRRPVVKLETPDYQSATLPFEPLPTINLNIAEALAH
jgi:hypothetical protein